MYSFAGVLLESGIAILSDDSGVWYAAPPYAEAKPIEELPECYDVADVIDWRRPLASLSEIPAVIAELKAELASGVPDCVVQDIYNGIDEDLAKSMIARVEEEYLDACRYTEVLEICNDLLKVPVVRARPEIVEKINRMAKLAETALVAIGGAAAAERFPS